MIEKISKDSFIFRELIDFWKMPTNLPVDFVIFEEEEYLKLNAIKFEKKTIAFLKSHISNEGRRSQFEISDGSFFRSSLGD